MTDTRAVRGVGAALVLAALIGTTAHAQSTATAVAAAPGAERYRLVEVAGTALPAEVEKEWGCREYVTRGALTLGADSSWSLRTTRREVCGDRVEVEHDDDDGIYKREGETLHFLDDDGRANTDSEWRIGTDIDLDELRTGIIGKGGTLTVQLADDETTLVFRPQP